MGELLDNEQGPFQMLFGDDASADPRIVLPIALAVFVILIILAMRIMMKDKGKSEMSEEELAKDRAMLDRRMEKQAEYEGKDYKPEQARVVEAAEIAEANRRYGKSADEPDTSA